MSSSEPAGSSSTPLNDGADRIRVHDEYSIPPLSHPSRVRFGSDTPGQSSPPPSVYWRVDQSPRVGAYAPPRSTVRSFASGDFTDGSFYSYNAADTDSTLVQDAPQVTASPSLSFANRAPRSPLAPLAGLSTPPTVFCRDGRAGELPEHLLSPPVAFAPARPESGYVSNLLELYALERAEDRGEVPDANGDALPTVDASGATPPLDMDGVDLSRVSMNRTDSMWSMGSDEFRTENPFKEGKRSRFLLEIEEQAPGKVESDKDKKEKERAEEKRLNIELNISSILHRQQFLVKMARAMMTFGAPAHRIETQLFAAARLLDLPSRFVHVPGLIICAFRDRGTMTTDAHFVMTAGKIALGKLHQIHQVYRRVVHDDISAEEGLEELAPLLSAPPEYSKLTRCCFTFGTSLLICILAFGGSIIDIGVAGTAGFIVALLQTYVASTRPDYALVFDTASVAAISFVARGLSSIHHNGHQLFCYSAITYASIGSLLPGFLILCAALELGSRSMMSGSTKLVFALITVMFIGFSLQIGSDIFLLFNTGERHRLDALTAELVTSIDVDGALSAHNMSAFPHLPLEGTWTFNNKTSEILDDVFKGCYRPESYPWYLQPFPWWSQIIVVPAFSLLSSLAALQPLWTWDLVVMVFIACASYAIKTVATIHIVDRPDIVAFTGALVVSVLGNAYSRLFHGTTFTTMMVGVKFLVPSGLSVAGGLNAMGNGVAIGDQLLQIVVGVTVGLFLGQVVVYLPGKKKTTPCW